MKSRPSVNSDRLPRITNRLPGNSNRLSLDNGASRNLANVRISTNGCRRHLLLDDDDGLRILDEIGLLEVAGIQFVEIVGLNDEPDADAKVNSVDQYASEVDI